MQNTYKKVEIILDVMLYHCIDSSWHFEATVIIWSVSNIYTVTQQYIPEDMDFQQHCCENLTLTTQSCFV